MGPGVKPTPADLELLRTIAVIACASPAPPTKYNISERLGITHRGAHERCVQARARGLVTWTDGECGTMRITERGKLAIGMSADAVHTPLHPTLLPCARCDNRVVHDAMGTGKLYDGLVVAAFWCARPHECKPKS